MQISPKPKFIFSNTKDSLVGFFFLQSAFYIQFLYCQSISAFIAIFKFQIRYLAVFQQ